MLDVKNDMEQLVRSEVSRVRAGRSAPPGACWCALCEADIVALALNTLPPRYCRGTNFGFAATQGHGAAVRKAVGRALDKVSRRPKHRPGAPDRLRSDVRIEDFALKIGASLAASFRAEGACGCESCRADALALALNRYPPKYGVSSPGRTSYQEQFADFIRHEIGLELARAAQVVTSNPNH